MTEKTKACNLTENEIKQLIGMHGVNLGNTDQENRMDRLNYLNKRLKEFNKVEPETTVEKTSGGWGNG